jgi:tetratricopeptide (TPR) repeat protein
MKIKDKIFDKLHNWLSSNIVERLKNQQNTVTIKAEDGSIININKIIGGNQLTNTAAVDNILANFNKKSPEVYSQDHSPIESVLSDSDKIYETKIQEAENYQRKWNFYEAIDVYLEIISDNPSLQIKFLVYVNLSICYLCLSNVQNNLLKAEKYLEKAELIQNPQYAEKLYYAKAIYFFHLNDFDLANSNIGRAIEIKPDYCRAINIKSLIQEKLGDPIPRILNTNFFNETSAIKDIFDNESSSLKVIGQLYLKNNEFENAIFYFKKALLKDQDDIVILSYLGDAYLFKAIDGELAKELVLTSNKLIELAESVKYYELAYAIGQKESIPEDLKYFLINYSVSLLCLGKHKEAYDKIQKAIAFGLTNDELFLNKARIETQLGKYDEALESYNNITDDSRFFEKALIYIVDGNFKKCIKYLQNKLDNESLDKNKRLIAEELLAEALIGDNQLDESRKLLILISRSGNESWRTHVSWSKYYEQINDRGKCLNHIETALKISDNHPQCVVDAVNIYGRNEKFEQIIGILNTIIDRNDCEENSYKKFVFVNLAKAQFYNRNLYEVISTFNKAIALGVERQAFNKLLIETYRDLGDYSKALNIALKEKEITPKDSSLLFLLGNFSMRIGRLEEGIAFFKDSLQYLVTGKINSSILVALGQAYILIGDNKNALHYANLAKNADIEIPSSTAHAFFMLTSLRCGHTDSSIEYMIDFNNNYPLNNLVQSIPSLEKDQEGNNVLTAEFVELLDKQSREFNKLLNTYRKNKLPLSFLTNSFNQPISHIYEWRNIYNIKININSGNPANFNDEIENSRQIDEMTIDFLSLLVFARIGLLDELLIEFRSIFLSHLTIEEIMNSILFSHNNLVVEIWDVIRNSPKVKFFTKSLSKNYIPDDLVKIFGQSLNDATSYAKENNLTQCVGDSITREFLKNDCIKTIGPLAILHRLLVKDKISLLEYSEAKLILMQENHHFVSFNEHEILCVAQNTKYNFDVKHNVYFDYILTCEPDMLSFVNVYMRMFVYLFKKITDMDILQGWVCKYSTVFNKLYLNSLCDNISFLKSRLLYSTDSGSDFLAKLTLPEIAFLQLIVIIETLQLTPQIKQQLIGYISDKITQADLFTIFYNKLIPYGRKVATQIKNENSQKMSEHRELR